ncbi:hypothetical protein P175DRAFT_0441906, partial [Aspergillus ochraceoroseus IBT 24754]
VSQDRHEIYITFTKFDDKYLAYRRGNILDHSIPSFLRMKEFGPWNTFNRKHITDVSAISSAITMRTW